MAQKTLIIFVKYPKPGFVKTRLGKSIGNNYAACFYKLLVEKTVKKVKSKNYNTVIFYTPASKESEIKRWLGKDLGYRVQKGRDLGMRMYNAFKEVFSQSSDRAVIIGTDVPAISKKIIDSSFSNLKKYDCVIGPSHDGGYYLLGLKNLQGFLFQSIKWSSDSVYKATVNIAKRNKLKVCRLRKLLDIDTESDLKRWLKAKKRLF